MIKEKEIIKKYRCEICDFAYATDYGAIECKDYCNYMISCYMHCDKSLSYDNAKQIFLMELL